MSKENESSGTHPLQFSLPCTKGLAMAMIIVLRINAWRIFGIIETIFFFVFDWHWRLTYVATKKLCVFLSRSRAALRCDKLLWGHWSRSRNSRRERDLPQNRYRQFIKSAFPANNIFCRLLFLHYFLHFFSDKIEHIIISSWII